MPRILNRSGRSVRRMLSTGLSTALCTVIVATGCANQPDTGLNPQPPAVHYAQLRKPFQNARLVVDEDTAAARWQSANNARWLDPITSQPQARWLNAPQDLAKVPAVVAAARRQRALPVFVAYYLPNRGCSDYREGAPEPAAYDAYIEQLVAKLGDVHSVIIMEPDAVPADCFDKERAELLKRATRRLAAAGHYVYLDAGHARWRPTGETAERLLAAGIEYAEGFSVNVSNRQDTDASYAWGRELSDLAGGREFVIDTSRNGAGPPPDDPNRDDEWCNPQQQALGAAPTTDVGKDRPGLAALLWIKAPGESDGKCGGETTYLFSPQQARNLIVHASWVPQAQRARAEAAKPAPVTDAG